MIKRNIIIPILIAFTLLPVSAQVKKQDLKREVTLYNPYKPSLPDSKKRSFLPDMNDSSKVKPVFHYEVKASPFLPEYTISPIKAAALLPDPLSKLYKSYINLGFGNHLTPLAELSITNERSKKGAVGFYARHFSTNGNVELDNGKKAFAGYMDNDASLFGRRFFRKNVLEGSLDYAEKSRYAYGYSPTVLNYSPAKKDIRIPYTDIGGKLSFSSITLDSTAFSYDFKMAFNYFTSGKDMFQKKVSFSGIMAKSFEGFYIGSGLKYNHYGFADFLKTPAQYVASISPFIKKTNEDWSFKIGIEALLEKDYTAFTSLHIYPDVNVLFNLVPSYVSFFAGLSGKLDKNEPSAVIAENPFLLQNGTLYKLPSTSHDLIISAGLKGNTGIGGNYLISASYSLISDMLFYSNNLYPDSVPAKRGNYFIPLTDDVNLLNIHGELGGPIGEKFSYLGEANIYNYTMSKFVHAWNKSNWDGKFALKYNLRDKIIAGVEIAAQAKRWMIVNGNYIPPAADSKLPPVPDPRVNVLMPVHININLTAEYRYSKILSFWAKFNNISNNHYYEWTYYPSQGFMFMLGLKYSL